MEGIVDMPKLTYLLKNNYHSIIDTKSIIPYNSPIGFASPYMVSNKHKL